MTGVAGDETSVVADESDKVFANAKPPALGVVNGLTAVELVACDVPGD
jgi:hypothetical protein